VATLHPGAAAIFAEGADHPSLIQVLKQPEKEDADKKRSRRVNDARIATAMKAICTGPIYDPAPGYNQYLKLAPEDLTKVRDLAQDVLEHPEFREQFSRYFLSLVLQPSQAVQGFPPLMDFIQRVAGRISPSLERDVAVAVFLHGLESLFDERGRRYRWFYNVSSALREQLTPPLVQIAREFENRQTTIEHLHEKVAAELQSFITAYRQQTDFRKRPGPFAGCIHCPHRCLYRWDIEPLLHEAPLKRDFVRAIQNTQNDQEMWRTLGGVAQSAAGRAAAVTSESLKIGAAICFTAQMSATLHFSAASQRKATQNVKKIVSQAARQ
jgi:hypothetical protein